MMFIGCQRVQNVELAKALDVGISFEEYESELPDYLSLTLTNESSVPLSLPDGLIVLEFTSFSGSLQRMVPVAEDLIESDPEWSNYKEYRLHPGEKLDLRISIREMLNGSKSGGSLSLPADDYTLNAFFTADKKVERLPVARKVRSNYIDLELNYSTNSLSINGL